MGGARRHCSARLAASLLTTCTSRPSWGLSSNVKLGVGVLADAGADLALCNKDAEFTQTGLAA